MSDKLIDISSLPSDIKIEKRNEIGTVVFDTEKYNVIYEYGYARSGKTTNLINNMCMYLDNSSTSRRVVYIVDSVLHMESLTKKIVSHMNSRYIASKSNPTEVFVSPTGDEWTGIDGPIFEYESNKNAKLRLECLCTETGLVSSVSEITSMIERQFSKVIIHNILVVDAASCILLTNSMYLDLVVLDDVSFTVMELYNFRVMPFKGKQEVFERFMYLVHKADNLWISAPKISRPLVDLFSKINKPSKRVLYRLMNGKTVESMLLCDDTKKMTSLLDDESSKYIVCDLPDFLEHIFKRLSNKFGISNCVLLQKGMKYEKLHRELASLSKYKFILTDPFALSGVDIDGEYTSIGIQFGDEAKINSVNSLMKVNNSKKIYMFDFSRS